MSLKNTIQKQERYGDICEVNTDLLYQDLADANLLFHDMIDHPEKHPELVKDFYVERGLLPEHLSFNFSSREEILWRDFVHKEVYE